MKKKLLTFGLLVVGIAVVGMLFRRYGSFELLVEHELRIRKFLSARPAAGFLIGLLSYFLLSLIPGTGGKSVIYGWLFGFWSAVVIADCALSAAAVVTFLISRSLLREGLRSRFALVMQRLDRAVERDGAYYLLALRMMHAPYTATNYIVGATSMRTISFWWSTQLGLLPSTMVFVFAGTQIPTLREVIEQGAGAVFTPQLLLALVLMGIFPLLLRWMIRRFWKAPPEEDLQFEE
jgi:uncharacterized membrane protein YdjX (TVP38/TMEM64 family)